MVLFQERLGGHVHLLLCFHVQFEFGLVLLFDCAVFQLSLATEVGDKGFVAG